jgi:Mlc titration factor MtfA (ptsG expression regulator)
MFEAIIIFLIIGLIITGILVHPALVKRRRNRLKHRPFALLWNAIVENNLPIYLLLSPAERK